MTRPTQLTEDQRSTITHALRVATEQFEQHARNCSSMGDAHKRVALQFERQALDARKLADDLSNALEVVVIVVTYD